MSLSCCGTVGTKCCNETLPNMLRREREPFIHHGVEKRRHPFSVKRPDSVGTCVRKCLRQCVVELGSYNDLLACAAQMWSSVIINGSGRRAYGGRSWRGVVVTIISTM
ncbi:hypothetical protein V6N13_145437 [Hibiscus sabdariffa]|uniref:Uncharacterized protein n=1 Tax=Hibiscus sabdariffa TaxID=183260 RepID=A0ABR2TQG5_9ROSI